jgi:hypothetical protein
MGKEISMVWAERKKIKLDTQDKLLVIKCLSLILMRAIRDEALVITFIWHSDSLTTCLHINYSNSVMVKRFNLNKRPFTDFLKAAQFYFGTISLLHDWNRKRLKKSSAGNCLRQLFSTSVYDEQMTFSFTTIPILNGQTLVITRVS